MRNRLLLSMLLLGALGIFSNCEKPEERSTFCGDTPSFKIGITYPNGGQEFQRGQYVVAKWLDCKIPYYEHMRLYLYGDTLYLLKDSTLVNEGKETVMIPHDVPPGPYRLVVTNIGPLNDEIPGVVEDMSDEVFIIE